MPPLSRRRGAYRACRLVAAWTLAASWLANASGTTFAFEKQFFEFAHDVSIVRGEETHGGGLASAATRATDAVRVLDGVRQP